MSCSRRGMRVQVTRVGAGGGREELASGALLGGQAPLCLGDRVSAWGAVPPQRKVYGTGNFCLGTGYFAYLGSLDVFRALATVGIRGDRDVPVARSASQPAQDWRPDEARSPWAPGQGHLGTISSCGQREPRPRSHALRGDAPSPVKVLRSCAFTGQSPGTQCLPSGCESPSFPN